MSAHGGTESADRVADVLLLFSHSDHPLGVSSVARSLSLSKAVVHRILRSLVSRSLLRVVPGGSAYVLGPAAARLSTRAWSQLDLRNLTAPILRALRDETRETTTLSVLIGHYRMYLEQFESQQEVKMVVELGKQLPLHSGASSRSMLAFLPEPYVAEAIRQLRSTNDDFDEEKYRAQLAEVRSLGYAESVNERGVGAAAIAAPYFDAEGNVIGAISSSGPVMRYREVNNSEHAQQVLRAASAITKALQEQ